MIEDHDILKSKILIVDDEPHNIHLLTATLKQEGYSNLYETEDPRKVLPMYREFRPDLVLLDLRMPHLDGFQVMDQLREEEKDSYLPVLVLTAHADANTRLRALNAGAKDFLSKPLDLVETVSRIRNMLEVRQLQNRIREQNKLLELKVIKKTEDLKTAQASLTHAEKLSTIGKLSANIAHEFNNPILGVRNVLEQVKEEGHLEKSLVDLVDLAIRECNRVMDLVRKLGDFYKPSSGILTPVYMHQVIDDMLALSHGKLTERSIRVVKKYAHDIPVITAVEDQVKQVVLNLLKNAEEAIPGSDGVITVSTEFKDHRVHITVADNGAGITAENMENLFDPFFTTKGAVKGTGLGLSVSYGIVKTHGGRYRCFQLSRHGGGFHHYPAVAGGYKRRR